MAWQEAITAGRHWDQDRDTPRIREAFVTLARTCERWPAPKHFLDALPRVEQVAIAHQRKPASPETVAKARAEVEAFLRDPSPNPEPVKPEREGQPLPEVERELRQHYATTGKMAAAGPDQ